MKRWYTVADTATVITIVQVRPCNSSLIIYRMQDIEYNRLRYVELKHGRISMRAVLDHIYYSLRRMYYLLLIGVL